MTSVREEKEGYAWRVTTEAAFRHKAFWKNGKKKVNGISELQVNDVGKKKSDRNITPVLALRQRRRFFRNIPSRIRMGIL